MTSENTETHTIVVEPLTLEHSKRFLSYVFGYRYSDCINKKMSSDFSQELGSLLININNIYIEITKCGHYAKGDNNEISGIAVPESLMKIFADEMERFQNAPEK